MRYDNPGNFFKRVEHVFSTQIDHFTCVEPNQPNRVFKYEQKLEDLGLSIIVKVPVILHGDQKKQIGQKLEISVEKLRPNKNIILMELRDVTVTRTRNWQVTLLERINTIRKNLLILSDCIKCQTPKKRSISKIEPRTLVFRCNECSYQTRRKLNKQIAK